MPRMFDILRGKMSVPQAEPKDAQGKEESRIKNINLSVNFPREIHDIPHAQQKIKDKFELSKKLIDAIKRKDIDSLEIAEEKYNFALALAQELLGKIEYGDDCNFLADEILMIVDIFTDQLLLGGSLLETVSREIESEKYLAAHLVNVCILSLALGVQMNFNKSKLHILGAAAFLHDLGMLSSWEIVKQPRVLSGAELEIIKNHPVKGAEIIPQMQNDYSLIKEIIKQHHERTNGSGYPYGIKNDQINEFAKIIGLVDAYEAMIHHRVYRQAKVPHEVIREISSSFKQIFDPEIIKALINKISIYPIGSFVRLNNGEIAKVISANADSLLRPLVLVLLDSEGRHIVEHRIIALAKQGSIYIKEPVVLK